MVCADSTLFFDLSCPTWTSENGKKTKSISSFSGPESKQERLLFFPNSPFPENNHAIRTLSNLSYPWKTAQRNPTQMRFIAGALTFASHAIPPIPSQLFLKCPATFTKWRGRRPYTRQQELSRECMERPTRIYCKQQCSPHPKRTQCRGGRHIPDDVMAQSWIIRTSRDFRRLYNLMSHKGSPFTEVPRGQSVTGANCLFYGTRGH